MRCLRGAHADASQRRLRMSPATLIAGLPALGSVLYMPLVACDAGLPQRSCRVLVSSPPFSLLLLVHWLHVVSEIAPEGPLEWIDGLDSEGRSCLRLHLLPDTDYLGWDRLLARGVAAPTPKSISRIPGRAASALRFHRRRLAGFDLLDAEPVAQLSPLGRQVAGRILRACAG